MEVVLINHTPEPLRTIYTAARTCYASGLPQQMWDQPVDQDKMVKLVDKTISSGHLSVTEHVTFVFAISGISRACSHQLVRHRIASFSQQSQRYVTFNEKLSYITPPQIAANENTCQAYNEIMNSLQDIYQHFIELGIPAEDARYLLPNASPTNLVMTMNLRELIHTASVRLCERAQWEIRQLFEAIAIEINSVSPILGKYFQPKCERLGYCDETENLSCGKMPTQEAVGL